MAERVKIYLPILVERLESFLSANIVTKHSQALSNKIQAAESNALPYDFRQFPCAFYSGRLNPWEITWPRESNTTSNVNPAVLRIPGTRPGCGGLLASLFSPRKNLTSVTSATVRPSLRDTCQIGNRANHK